MKRLILLAVLLFGCYTHKDTWYRCEVVCKKNGGCELVNITHYTCSDGAEFDRIRAKEVPVEVK